MLVKIRNREGFVVAIIDEPELTVEVITDKTLQWMENDSYEDELGWHYPWEFSEMESIKNRPILTSF